MGPGRCEAWLTMRLSPTRRTAWAAALPSSSRTAAANSSGSPSSTAVRETRNCGPPLDRDIRDLLGVRIVLLFHQPDDGRGGILLALEDLDGPPVRVERSNHARRRRDD